MTLVAVITLPIAGGVLYGLWMARRLRKLAERRGDASRARQEEGGAGMPAASATARRAG
jgi:hypothetical protein